MSWRGLLGDQPNLSLLRFRAADHRSRPRCDRGAAATAVAPCSPAIRTCSCITRSDDGSIEKVFSPVFPPDRNAAEVSRWLAESSRASG
jgi:hypothetical protein